MTEQSKLDQLLAMVQGLTDRITKAETDAQLALDSANNLQKTVTKKLPAPAPDHGNGGGLSLEDALRLVQETEERTTKRIESIISVINSANQNQQKTFRDGINLGREIAELSMVDEDGDGKPDYADAIGQLLDFTTKLKRGKANGVHPPPSGLSGGQALGNYPGDDGEN